MPAEALRTAPAGQRADVTKMLAGGLAPERVADQIVDATYTFWAKQASVNPVC